MFKLFNNKLIMILMNFSTSGFTFGCITILIQAFYDRFINFEEQVTFQAIQVVFLIKTFRFFRLCLDLWLKELQAILL